MNCWSQKFLHGRESCHGTITLQLLVWNFRFGVLHSCNSEPNSSSLPPIQKLLPNWTKMKTNPISVWVFCSHFWRWWFWPHMRCLWKQTHERKVSEQVDKKVCEAKDSASDYFCQSKLCASHTVSTPVCSNEDKLWFGQIVSLALQTSFKWKDNKVQILQLSQDLTFQRPILIFWAE